MAIQESRRQFLQTSTLAAASALAPSLFVTGTARAAFDQPLNVGVVGCGRGLSHIRAAIKSTNAKLTYICDVESGRLAGGMKLAESLLNENGGEMPTPEVDLRRLLDDPQLDAIFIAAPNHWHAPAAIMACNAGKHVYVEKPGSQNPWESEMIVAAAEKNKRVVQMGNQRRTWPGLREGIAKMKDGLIGETLYARCWYNSARGSIGKGKETEPPTNLNWDLWQGPAGPEQAFMDNIVPYNWHWVWHFGNGELGNNGVHALDVARWGLGVDHPKKVTYLGGRYHYDDDQETPDTGSALYDYGDKGISWESSSCLPRRDEKNSFVAFYGREGTLHIIGTGYVAYDLQGKEIAKGTGAGGEQEHIDNFLTCIRDGGTPNSVISDAQISSMMCHLGNIAYRTSSVVEFDPEQKILNNEPAMKLWKREYRSGWEPKV